MGKPASEERIPISLTKVVKDVIASTFPKGKEVDFVCKEDLLILSDPRALRSAVENLLINALQWSKTKVRVTLSREGDWAVLTVEDDGPGVLEEDRSRIFEPFFSKRDGGSGLGLAIVKKFILDMGGFILVDRSPLGGAKFSVKLPIYRESDESSNT